MTAAGTDNVTTTRPRFCAAGVCACARRALDLLYQCSEALAALMLVTIFSIMLVQVAFGLVDRVAAALGYDAPGISVPSYAEFCGFLLAGSIFMGCGGALRAGSHVRVSLLLAAAPPLARRVMQTAVSALATGLVSYYAWNAGKMAYDSWDFGDRSFGAVSIPMWVPQAAMVLGLVVMAVALADLTISFLRGAAPPWGDAEEFPGE